MPTTVSDRAAPPPPDRTPPAPPDPGEAGDSAARLLDEFEAVLDTVPSSLRVFDASGTLTRLNAAARGEHDDATRPRTLATLWALDDPVRVDALPAGGDDAGGPRAPLETHPAVRALAGETVRAEAYAVRRGPGGERRVVDTYARPLRDAAGQVVGAVLVERDTTERARLARALDDQVRRTAALNARVAHEAAELERMAEARSRELLTIQEARARERRLAAVGQLAAGVMHDVNNALNPIMAAAFLLQRRADDPAAVRDYAQRIARAAETCAASAARVGRFIRQEPPAEGRDLPLDLSLLADEVLAMVRTQWADGGTSGGPGAGQAYHVGPPGVHGAPHGAGPGPTGPVAFEARLAPGVTARGLPGEVREALLNLVHNAIDAMPGGGRLTVSTGVAPGRGAVGGPGRRAGDVAEAWIEVRDTGVGMSDDVRDRAFEPFFSTKGARGSGLGLAEVYGIMKRHRGRAEIDSAVGHGTAVRLVFPFVAGEGAAAAPEGEHPEADGAGGPAARHVLVVEDHAEGREFLRALLASDGHRVDAAADAAAARRKLERATARPAGARGPAPYDVLITDIGLPDGNGWDLVREARARWPALRIAVVTGWEPQVDPAGAADVTLRKPLHADEVLRFVAAAPAAGEAANGDPAAGDPAAGKPAAGGPAPHASPPVRAGAPGGIV
jgi:signal transduction histidine kinase/ActR/RegA family two-component response regulator